MLPLIVLLGPTASGKTKLAVQLAVELNAEIISADSRQVYKKMDIGTGKDLNEYCCNGINIPYHLIDICDAGEQYNLYRFQQDFKQAYQTIRMRGKNVILCGGTGLYMEAVLKDFSYTSVPVDFAFRKELELLSKEELLQRLLVYNNPFVKMADTSSHKRLVRAVEIGNYLEHNNPKEEFLEQTSIEQYIVFGIDISRDVRRERITKRLKTRADNGMIEEVKGLMQDGLTLQQLVYYGLEYKFIALYLTGQLSWEDMYNQLECGIHRFAKRQMTYFRKMEKDDITIHWIDGSVSTGTQLKSVREHLKTL